jgi:cell division septation protein DedD
LAHPIPDDGFHEIQLNGKQLVFLFMAATVVSVVIFLCGVLVGRGVRAERAVSAAASEVEVPVADASTPGPEIAATVPAESDPTAAAPPPTVDDLSYFSRLEERGQPAETLKPAKPAAAPPPAPATPREAEPKAAAPAPVARAATTPRQPEPTPPAPPAAASPARAATPAPSAGTYTVQVAALNVRSEADAIAKRFVDKGYAAYVVSPAQGSAAIYRVRIGSFKTRREADTIAAKLQKEERLTPWVTK